MNSGLCTNASAVEESTKFFNLFADHELKGRAVMSSETCKEIRNPHSSGLLALTGSRRVAENSLARIPNIYFRYITQCGNKNSMRSWKLARWS